MDHPPTSLQSAAMEPDLVYARATIHLPGGLHPSEVYLVNAAAPYVRDCLACGALVIEDAQDNQSGFE